MNEVRGMSEIRGQLKVSKLSKLFIRRFGRCIRPCPLRSDWELFGCWKFEKKTFFNEPQHLAFKILKLEPLFAPFKIGKIAFLSRIGSGRAVGYTPNNIRRI